MDGEVAGIRFGWGVVVSVWRVAGVGGTLSPGYRWGAVQPQCGADILERKHRPAVAAWMLARQNPSSHPVVPRALTSFFCSETKSSPKMCKKVHYSSVKTATYNCNNNMVSSLRKNPNYVAKRDNCLLTLPDFQKDPVYQLFFSSGWSPGICAYRRFFLVCRSGHM